jgi:hypothetical protein
MEKWAMDNLINRISEGKETESAIDEVLRLSAKEQESLFAALGRLKNEKTARFLEDLFPRTVNSGLQKLIKKTAFRLKSQGVVVDDLRTAGGSILRKMEVLREAQAFLSSYDQEQVRTAVVAVETRRNHFVLAHAMLHFSKGLLQLQSLTLNRNSLERIIEGYIAAVVQPLAFESVSPPYVGYLVTEGAALSGKQTEDARGLVRILSETRGDIKKPVDIMGLPLSGEVFSSPAETVFSDDLFRFLNLLWPGMEADQKRMTHALHSTIVLPPHLLQERKDAFLAGLLENDRIIALSTPFKRLLEDYAYLFYRMGRFDCYKGSLEILKDGETVKKALIYFVLRTLEAVEKEKTPQPEVLVDPFSRERR